MASKVKLMVILGALVVFGAIFASSASAANPFLKAWKNQPGAKYGVSESKSKSTVVVLADEKIGGAEVNSPKCFWGDGLNSGETATGEIFWFYDTHMKMCPDKKSSTGWVKVAGGMTGRDCENEVKPNAQPLPEEPKIIILPSFGKYKVKATAHALEKVHSSCGVAEATATAHGMAYGMTKIQAQSNAKVVASAKAQAAAYAEARVALVCSPSVATPEAPKPPAGISCGNGEIREVKNGQIFCVKQTNEAEQHCQANGGTWNGSQQLCTIIQINANCSSVTVVNGSGNVVESKQEGNCNQEIKEEKSCGCHPEEPEKPKTPESPVVEWERIQEVYLNHERKLCVTVTPTSSVKEVQFAVAVGQRSNGGKGVYNASTNKYCVEYTAPTEKPAHECQEEWISLYLPPGTKCDVAHVAVFCSNGAETVKGQMEIPILEEAEAVVWKLAVKKAKLLKLKPLVIH